MKHIKLSQATDKERKQNERDLKKLKSALETLGGIEFHNSESSTGYANARIKPIVSKLGDKETFHHQSIGLISKWSIEAGWELLGLSVSLYKRRPLVDISFEKIPEESK